MSSGPFVRISYNEVSVDHPEAFQILAAPLWKSDWYKLFAVPNSTYNSLTSECDPKKYATMRSNLASGFSGSSVMKSEPFMDKTIQLLEQRLDELSQQKKPFEFGLWLHFLTWDIMGEVMFSTRVGFLDQGRDIGNSIKNNFGLALYVTSTAYAQWLHALLLSNPILRWLDFQPKELSAIWAPVATRKESLRLYPGVPWNLPRVVPRESLTVAGHHFTHGTILSVNPWLIHRNAACFGKDANNYNPKR
ncbi:hypothetical protein HO133_001085 [Letharia lupina]|uniref:Uncharacterized protein n=1 Tax=Letharia lupina TaxID=560253 RepID=A0A8H6CGC2_9LECA|nr:uncharacterized protein HO133_001085 [Letharia lupina]KAF6223033.1 hypothetical protein HO133_001085 [Letharia lupina]